MKTLSHEMSLQEKLNILADAAKYDVACTSSGSAAGRKALLEIPSLPASVTVLLPTGAAFLY